MTEIYEWIGPSINSFLEPLKPIQVKELHEKFEKCKNVGSKTQKRLLRSQQEIQEQEMDVDMAGIIEYILIYIYFNNKYYILK